MKRFALAVCLFVITGIGFGAIIPDYDRMQKHVTDTAGYLTKEQASILNQKMAQFETTSSTQVALVTVETLDGLEPVNYAQQLFKKWGIGQKDKNNGVLLLVAKKENKIRIHVGYGLEGVLPDITAKQIISKQIRPLFNDKKYYEAFDIGTGSIMKVCAGEYAGVAKSDELSTTAKTAIVIFVIIMLIILIYSATHPESDIGLLVWGICDIVTSNSSGGGDGGGGDGGSSFGGGDSGGGGADG